MGLVGFNGILLVGFNYEWLWTIKFMEIPHVQLVKSRTENWVGHNSLVSIIDKLKYPKTLWIVIVFIKYIQFDSISPYLGVQITLFTPTAMTKIRLQTLELHPTIFQARFMQQIMPVLTFVDRLQIHRTEALHRLHGADGAAPTSAGRRAGSEGLERMAQA